MKNYEKFTEFLEYFPNLTHQIVINDNITINQEEMREECTKCVIFKQFIF